MDEPVKGIWKWSFLSCAKFRLPLEVTTLMVLFPYKGGVFRGSFGNAFRKVVCAVPRGDGCTNCLMCHQCPYVALFAPRRLSGCREVQPGSSLLRTLLSSYKPRVFSSCRYAGVRTDAGGPGQGSIALFHLHIHGAGARTAGERAGKILTTTGD